MEKSKLNRVLFDLEASQPIGNVKRHGGGKYAEVVFNRLIERHMVFSCFYNSNKWINPAILEKIKSNGIPLFDVNEKGLETIVKENGITSVYSALPGSVLKLRGCRVYGTIHDLRQLELPFDNFFYKYIIPKSLNPTKERLRFFVKSIFHSYARKKTTQSYLENYFNTSMKIITVSEHTRYEILAYIPEIKNMDIKVFYSPNTSSLNAAKKNEGAEKYFLSVSGKVWLKNVLRSIIAFDNLVTNGLVAGIKYVITGASPSDFKYKINNPSSFVFLGYVEDSELESLYANAYAFVYPSLSEGFGYPPLEAMRYKVPVIASPISSISQILDTGALYFNPFSIEEIMNRMMMIMRDDFHHLFSERGYRQYLKVKERQDRDLDLLIDYFMEKE